MSTNKKITSVTAGAVPVRGNDIDTDRIIPARFLKCVTFDELGPHAFEDDRKACANAGEQHPFDNPGYQGAGILIVNNNFGCGSSREHAPQSLSRWGIQGIVGESFAEIFFGNCVSLGIPCAVLDHDTIEEIQDSIENDPGAEWSLDVEEQVLKGPASCQVEFDEGARSQFLAGTWNPLQGLLANREKTAQLASALPYMSGF